jgi:XTP/dITP diphosphohydrolase
VPQLLLATENKGKLRELRALLADLSVELLAPSELRLALNVVEDGETYADNASRKALAFAQASGLTSLADDSGLEVDVLDGAPGLYSHRYAPGPQATDADRRTLLLRNLRHYPRPWTAHFHATVAIASPDGQIRLAEGDCPGEIIPEERGEDGFGYDPIFLLSEMSQTMAELSMEEKNRLSHRARAIQRARPILLIGDLTQEIRKKPGCFIGLFKHEHMPSALDDLKL